MSEMVNPPAAPHGLTRLLWRLPIGLYRAHLGWMLGERFLLLEHTGRKSGKKRRVVVEVIRHDREDDRYYIVSGFGEKSDWLLNLEHTPHATIQVGRRRLEVTARRLTPAEGEKVMVDYARRHPGAIRELVSLLGYAVEQNEAGYRQLGRALPVVAFDRVDGSAG